MRSIFSYVLFLTGLCLLWLSCANIVSPTGGPKDEKAPLIKKRSLMDSSVNFKGGNIVFEFNEFVQVKDIQNQLVITPLLKNNPKVTVHKRYVTVHMDDSLLEKNTTYSISMGNAIMDVREGNPYQNLNFTFSTGSYFDSLSLKGRVIEANTGKPDTSCYVVLYPSNLPDSAFYLQKPMYVQKLQAGTFYFKNLPDKDFKLYALQDLNKNFRYDLNTERIAFHEKFVNPKDSSDITLFSFIESNKPDTVVRGRTPQRPVVTEKSSKLNYTLNVDTVNKTKRTFDLNDTLTIHFDLVLKVIDEIKIRVYQDSVLDASAEIRLDSSRKNIKVITQWTEEANYKVVLQKGFAQDSSGLSAAANEFRFKTKRTSDYGYLSVQCTKNEFDLIELLRGEKVIARKVAGDSIIQFSLLNPDNYQLRVLHDKNKNGLWDSGSFWGEKKQPELVELLPSQITIKANWENKVNLKDAFTKKITSRK